MAMSIGQQAAASLSGNIETALLVIHDYREQAAKDSSDMSDNGRTLTTEDELYWFSSTRSWHTKKALEGTRPLSYPGSQDRILKVQFNPAQLTLNAIAGPKSELDSTTGRSRTMAVEDATLNLTTILYFDDMQTYDAFMWDKFTASLTVQGAANVISAVEASNGKTHSVQGQVEALLAVLRNPYTRTISFRWADFAFIGQLNTVQARYTMFSPSGRPVRAQVALRIQHEMDPSMLHTWYENFEKAFGGETGNLVRQEQTTGNLLNLTL